MKKKRKNTLLFCLIFLNLNIFKINDKALNGWTIEGNVMASSSSKAVNYVRNPSGILVLVNKNNSLNPNYVPGDLTRAKVAFVNGVDTYERLLRKDAADSLKRMFESAKGAGMQLYGLSGYRSYKVQEQLYNTRLRNRGRQYTDLYTAAAGKSEHQTGLAIDITNRPTLSGAITIDFGNTKEGKWLHNNAHNFGFILRYPRGKEHVTKYNYEPWHFRYVGVTAARHIKSKGIVLEEYLNQK